MDILRFITAGSVDNGKSTLIGRLLHDSNSILTDQFETVAQQSINVADEGINLAFFTDGLRVERELGITIDVAYKYFATPTRKFIIADTPGHVEYTRNMITGASNADLAIILIDARYGLTAQTRKHTLIVSLMGIKHLVIAINKMDLVGYSQDAFRQIIKEYQQLISVFNVLSATFIPLSALNGDNVVEPSGKMSWYKGKTLLSFLEQVDVKEHANLNLSRFPVQYVIRSITKECPDFIGYAGKIISGIYKKGDRVKVLPLGTETRIKSIRSGSHEVEEAFAPQSIILQLTDAVKVNRGDMIVVHDNMPKLEQEICVILCWMDVEPLTPGNYYILQLNSTRVKALIREIDYRLNVDTMQKEYKINQAQQNDVVRVILETASPVPHDAYAILRENGGAILINEATNATVAACMIQG